MTFDLPIGEAELGWLRQRAGEALLAKVRRGELIVGLPASLGVGLCP